MRRDLIVIFVLATVLLGLFAVNACRSEVKPKTGSKVTAAKRPRVYNLKLKDNDSLKKEISGQIEVKRMGPKAPAIMVTASLVGYTEPCGCTIDITLGGIDRIVGYMDKASQLYDETLYLDAGNLLFEFDHYRDAEIPQEKARVQLVAKALKEAKLRATVPGKLDFALGAPFYTKTVKEIGAIPLGANMSISGKPLIGMKRLAMGKQPVLVIGVADPKLYKDVKGVEVTDPVKALKSVFKTLEKEKGLGVPIILLSQGDLAFTKSVLDQFEAIDFGVVGVRPRMTDQTDTAGKGVTLEAYDQGRYVGILSLIHLPETQKPQDLEMKNGRLASASDIEKYKKRVEHLDKSIDKVPPDKSGEPRPIVLKLQAQKQALLEKIEALKADAIKITEDPTFLWNTVAMEPGLPTSPTIEALKREYNQSLEDLNRQVTREVKPAVKGQAFYVGNQVCGTCHVEAMQFWKTTAHASALKTLQDRNKAWDQTCIGCHVVGYEKPGGSTLGHLSYQAKIQIGPGNPPQEIKKDLANVGCETCHGPGSQHVAAPVGADNKAQFIRLSAKRDDGTVVCQQCHVPHHSPRFNYDLYVKQITGPGHKMSLK